METKNEWACSNNGQSERIEIPPQRFNFRLLPNLQINFSLRQVYKMLTVLLVFFKLSCKNNTTINNIWNHEKANCYI